jgi:hypothetical protein
MRRSGTFSVIKPLGVAVYKWADYYFVVSNGVLYIEHRKTKRGQSHHLQVYNRQAWVRVEGPGR